MPIVNVQIILVFLGIAAISAVLVGILRRLALGWQILDVPNQRSSHESPTPRGGGLAIVVLSLAGYSGYGLWLAAPPKAIIYIYLAGAALIALISWIDDVRGLPNRVRFGVHLLSAILIILGIGAAWKIVAVPFFGDVALGMLGTVLALFWIVGLTNTYNFMDGIDGIAAAQALMAGAGWMILGAMSDQGDCVAIGLLIAAASAGFLWWNLPPAKIFMGDVGSAFLGFTFAVLPVIAAQRNNRLAAAGMILVWPFVFDSVFTLLRRLSKGENIFQAHRSHLYQRLVQNGWTHGQVSSLYAALAGIGIVPAAMFVRWPMAGSWLIVILLPLLAVGLWSLVVHQEKVFIG